MIRTRRFWETFIMYKCTCTLEGKCSPNRKGSVGNQLISLVLKKVGETKFLFIQMKEA